MCNQHICAAKQYVNIVFVKPDDTRVSVKAAVGDSMLELAHANNIDIEGTYARCPVIVC
jgi:hypothetical protein